MTCCLVDWLAAQEELFWHVHSQPMDSLVVQPMDCRQERYQQKELVQSEDLHALQVDSANAVTTQVLLLGLDSEQEVVPHWDTGLPSDLCTYIPLSYKSLRSFT
jgi:hypothetical protein